MTNPGCSRLGSHALTLAIAASLALSAGQVRGQSPQAPVWPGRNAANELSLKITMPFTVAAMGDIIMPQPLNSQDPRYLQLINIIRQADVAFANMETSLVDISRFTGTIGGTEAPLETGQAIKDMGIDIMNRANNHTFDGGLAGMESTDDALDKLGIAHAGTGKDLHEARAAHFLETSKGRVGLVGMFSIDDVGNYGPNYQRAQAGYRVAGVGGAPGVNALHLTDYHIVTEEQLQSLRAVRDGVFGRSSAADTKQLKFYDDWFRAGTSPGSISFTMNAGDEKDILQSIRNGKLYSEFMIATIHAHQTTTSGSQGTMGRDNGVSAEGAAGAGVDHEPPDFLIRLAHESIDNGADMFVAHGVHALHGVEIYKGRPVFYGLSNFVFQFGLQYGMMPDPDEKGPTGLENPASQESVLTTSRYEGGRLTEVRIYPVDLGGTRRPISLMGIPMTPTPEVAQRILKAMQDYSKPYGTKISIEGNVGVIHVGAEGQGAAK
jgi:poly-gamma-glutamate synthesis protein (capsule biosynthesis protein)